MTSMEVSKFKDKIDIEPLTKEQINRRKQMGLSVNDRFHELVQSKPSQLQKIYDQNTRNKIPMEFETVSKPNTLVSFTGLSGSEYNMSQLGNMSPEEFVGTAERLNSTTNSQAF